VALFAIEHDEPRVQREAAAEPGRADVELDEVVGRQAREVDRAAVVEDDFLERVADDVVFDLWHERDRRLRVRPDAVAAREGRGHEETGHGARPREVARHAARG
jgi:hypothetical protein